MDGKELPVHSYVSVSKGEKEKVNEVYTRDNLVDTDNDDKNLQDRGDTNQAADTEKQVQSLESVIEHIIMAFVSWHFVI